ncbi:uncharacterized protein LOC115970018 [Quercus lobata]|uniref:RRM domain-containing protein n=1 Tax=Quercus lobata TaxID=97700 RepID=A0A7N2REU9_QUELO|nr:uncharacterized protein LOC115970018 [Quercus lobata]
MMLKPRLGACLSSLLFTGEHGVVSVSSKLRAVCCIQRLANFQLEGIQSLRRSFYSSSGEDDDFAELGSPVVRSLGTLKKLKTEKPEPFRKNEHAKRSSSGKSLRSEASPSLKDNSTKLVNSSLALRLKLDNLDNVSSNPNNVNASNFNSSSSISVEKIPSSVSLSQLKEALSTFGKISKASMRSKPKKRGCCYIQFESVESCERAISAGVIAINSYILPIHPLLVEDNVTFSISNISSETADSTIHSICMSYGPLEGLVRTKKGVVDALFGVKNNSDLQSILEKLNHTIMDDCNWTACLNLRDSATEVMSNNNDNQCDLGMQISNHLADLKKEMSIMKVHLSNKTMKVHADDLQNLHHVILHLEAPLAAEREVPNID